MSGVGDYELDIGGGSVVAEVFELAAACYGAKVEPRSWWDWYLFGCPTTTTRVVLARRDGRVAGMQPVLVTGFRRGEERLCGGMLCGGMVHPDHRRRGLFQALVRASVDEASRLGAAFAVTMPNALSLPAFQKMGWRDAGERSLMVAPAVGLKPNRSRRRGPGVEVVSRFGEGLDELLKGESIADGSVRGDRTRSWLDWRLSGNPLGEYLLVERRGPSGELSGVAAGRITRRAGVKVGWLVDFFARDVEAVAALTGGLKAEMRSRGALLLATVAPAGDLGHALRCAGFRQVHRRLSPKRFHTVWLPIPTPAQETRAFLDDAPWCLTLVDWDGI